MTGYSGGLRIPDTVGVGTEAHEEIHETWSTYDQAKADVEMKFGMMPLKEPDFAPPTLTLKDLTESQGKDYTEKYLYVTGWYGYLGEVKARLSAQILELDNEMNQISSRMRESMRSRSTRTTRGGESKAPPAQEMEDKIRLDPRYTELGVKKQGIEQMRSMIASRIERHEYEIKLLSRQVEIKRTEWEHANRAGGINGQGGIPTGRAPRGLRNDT